MQIELKNVSYTYNQGNPQETEALSDINLQIGGDSFVALIGSTGSGKSTLIQLLNGLIKPTSGKITFDGNEIYGHRDEKKLLRALRCKVGLTFQYPEYQLFEKDVYADVSFGPKNLGCDKTETDRRVMRALRAVNIGGEYYKKSPFELSGGEMRRVAIAGMLAMEPEMLILDEPTAGLDPKGKTEILDRIRDIQKERHITVVLVSHSMEEVAEYADRVIAMNHSRVIMDMPVHEIFHHYEELEEMGLSVPSVNAFARELNAAGFEIDPDVITVKEAAESILKAFGMK